jgi:hypothetical protein
MFQCLGPIPVSGANAGAACNGWAVHWVLVRTLG